jgi:hypothetical protein
MERVDALAADAAEALAEAFEEFLFPDVADAMLPRPEDCWAPGPFLSVC